MVRSFLRLLGSYLDVLFALRGERRECRDLLHGGGVVVGDAVHGAAGLAAAGHAVLAPAQPVVQLRRPGTHVAVRLPRAGLHQGPS